LKIVNTSAMSNIATKDENIATPFGIKYGRP
jgi:hypothetical protein